MYKRCVTDAVTQDTREFRTLTRAMREKKISALLRDIHKYLNVQKDTQKEKYVIDKPPMIETTQCFT